MARVSEKATVPGERTPARQLPLSWAFLTRARSSWYPSAAMRQEKSGWTVT